MSIDSRAIQYGKIFGDWSIRELIGQGSGGRNAVFKLARNKFAYEEISAMKVINIIEESGSYKELSSEYKAAYDSACEELWQKAEEEVRLMYNLRGNGNIVRYLDCDCADWVGEKSFGRDLLIRMDCLDNLRERMKHQLFSEKEIIRIGKDICNALTACHGIKIWHRDIKPDNIFINQYEGYMLGDFGISKMVEDCNSVETMAGTKAYAPPEQFIGRYDHRIDIYSLGLTLYELANGNRLPFAGTAYVRESEIRMRLDGNAFPKIDRVSSKLNEVIMRACEYDPDKRFQSAKEFNDALSEIKETEMLETVSVPVEMNGATGTAYETVLSSAEENSYETELSSVEENSYETELSAEDGNNYETVMSSTGAENYETIMSSTGAENYETVMSSTGAENYETVMSTTEEKNYETVLSATDANNYETVLSSTEDSNYETVVLPTECDKYTTMQLPSYEQSNIESNCFVKTVMNEVSEANVEKPQLWYAKKSNDKIQVKIRRIDLEPNTKQPKSASSSLWYGKKK